VAVRVPARAVALTAVLTFVAASAVVPAGASRQAQSTATGTIRIAAEEELACADWIGTCAALVWGNWELGNLTLPQALNVSSAGEYVPGAMLVDFPTLEAGPPQKVTYRIRPEAVWSDGTPITSTDFKYTWEQIVNGDDIYDQTGYLDIASVDDTDPKVAVVTFKEPFAAWRDLFGGFYFVMPSHLLDGKDRAKAMKDGYAFSGGPWKLEGGKKGWKKGRSITLVPNDAYWGVKATISKVVFQFITDSNAELQAVKTGQVVAAYPLPIDGALDQLDELPNLAYTVSYGNQFEAFWINAAAFPFDSEAVRQAVAYATDRQTLVDQILTPAVREGRVLQSFIVPTFQQFFEPSFDIYDPDPAKVEELMTGDGWAKNSDGIWEKDGRTASFEVNSTAGNEARERTEQIWQSQLEQNGFDLTIKNLDADVFFGSRLPKGNYAVGLFASVGTPDPGQCLLFCSQNIPSKKTKFSGNNIMRTDDAAIDQAWTAADREIDDTARIALVEQGQQALADYVASIPLFQTPLIFVYDRDRLGGRLEDNTVMGPFFTMNEWVLK
jgi:peptide/nickel transport system substrate-binding protein